MSKMQTDAEQPININISKNSDTSNKYSKFKEYIIINNLDLQTEVNNLKDKLSDMSKELNEKEIEEDKTDSSTRYLRGLVNNLNEIKKGYCDINKENETLVIETKKIWNNIYKTSEKYHLYLIFYNIIFVVVNIIIRFLFNNKMQYIIGITLNIIIIYTIVKSYINYYNKIKKYKKDIKTIEDKVKCINKEKLINLIKLEESTLALDNWIYEV